MLQQCLWNVPWLLHDPPLWMYCKDKCDWCRHCTDISSGKLPQNWSAKCHHLRGRRLQHSFLADTGKVRFCIFPFTSLNDRPFAQKPVFKDMLAVASRKPLIHNQSINCTSCYCANFAYSIMRIYCIPHCVWMLLSYAECDIPDLACIKEVLAACSKLVHYKLSAAGMWAS